MSHKYFVINNLNSVNFKNKIEIYQKRYETKLSQSLKIKMIFCVKQDYSDTFIVILWTKAHSRVINKSKGIRSKFRKL